MLLSDRINENYGRKIVDTKDNCIVLKPIVSRTGDICISGENMVLYMVKGIVEEFIIRGDQWDKCFKASGYRNIRNVKYYNGKISTCYTPVTSQAGSYFETFVLDNVEIFSTTPIINTFSACENLKHILLTNCYSKNLEWIQGIFELCPALEVITINECKFPMLKSLKKCFANCTGLKCIENHNDDFTNVKDLYGCFYECQNFNMDISNLYFGDIVNICFTFKNCISLTHANLSNWCINVLNGYECFMGCERLIKVKFNRLTQIPITCMTRMFCDCGNLEYIDLSMTYLATNNVSLVECFMGCQLLKKLNITQWDPAKKPIMSNCFIGCRCLSHIICSHEMYKYLDYNNSFPTDTCWTYDNNQNMAVRICDGWTKTNYGLYHF